jgi:hypothetical protein
MLLLPLLLPVRGKPAAAAAVVAVSSWKQR